MSEIDEKLYREIIAGTNEDPDVEDKEDEVIDDAEQPERDDVEDSQAQGGQEEYSEDREEVSEADTSEHEGEGGGGEDDGGKDEIEQLREEINRLKQANMSISGRASKAAKELNALREERERISLLTGLSTEELSRLDDKALEELKADYNVDLGSINKLIEEHQSLKGVVGNTLPRYEQELAELRAQVEAERAASIVRRLHPDLDDVITSNEFITWRESLPPRERDFVKSTNDPHEIGNILDIFKSQSGWNKAAKVDVPVDTIAQRKKREKSSVGAKSRGVAAKVGNGNGRGMLDEKSIYEEVYGRIYG